MIHFVGAGSGAPDLITVRGKKYLEEADVVIYAGSLVNPKLLEYTKDICTIYNSAKMTLEEVLSVMEKAEAAGKTTVRLHTGDPCIYGAIREQMDVLDEKGIAYEEKTASTNDEVITAASALVADGVDAVFTPTDNVIMAAELAIYENLAEAAIPHYTGADSFVRNGAFATCGVNYTDLGHQTADLAYDAMTKGMDDLEDYYLMDGGIITVNTETAAALGIDYSVFNDMGEVVEVTTTEE